MQAIAKNPESNSSASINLPFIQSTLFAQNKVAHYSLAQDPAPALETLERLAASPDYVQL